MEKQKREEFADKVKTATAIITVTILLILLFIYSFKVLLLIFAAVMVAVFFRAIAGLITRKTGLAIKWSLPISIIGVVGLWTLLFILLQPQVSSQIKTLKEDLPQAADKVKSDLEKSNAGEFILSQLPEFSFNKSSESTSKPNDQEINQNQGPPAERKINTENGSLKDMAQKFFSTTLGVLGDMYAIFLLGIFFTANPAPYKKGIIKLFPLSKRDRCEEVVVASGVTLKLWLFGKMLSMLVVAVLSALGLWALGVPMFITLALFAGLVSFIPNFGPIIAIIPAFLVGFVQSPTMGLYVILLYIGVQVVESNIINPIILKRQIDVPMAMSLFSQLIFAVFAGGLGLIFATPIMAMVMVIIQMVYIEDILGDKSLNVKSEKIAKKKLD